MIVSRLVRPCSRWNIQSINLGLILFLSKQQNVARSFSPSSLCRSGFFSTGANSYSLSSRSRFRMMSTTTTTTTITFDDIQENEVISNTLIIGKKKTLQNISLDLLLLPTNSKLLQTLLQSIESPSGGSTSTFIGGGGGGGGDSHQKLTIGVIPDKVSRNNHPWSVHSITDMVSTHIRTAAAGGKAITTTNRIILVGSNDVQSKYQGALIIAIAKAFPLYSQKTTAASRKGEQSNNNNNNNNNNTRHHKIHVSFWDEEHGQIMTISPHVQKAILAAVDGVRLAGRLVDMPPCELTTDVYAKECRSLAKELGGRVVYKEIVGDELNRRGYGGIYGVGKTAVCPPRLIIMEYTPPSSSSSSNNNNNNNGETVCLVGKAIVYDTGGLSLKTKTGMCGMKSDMGGSAGVLGGFISAVKAEYPHKLTLLLCMAENAIGPSAFRNDDILTLYSGKTVEINNCDAEGRLVLGDGVAHATRHVSGLDLVVDMATLTGAQMITTGKKHGGILANTPQLEQRAIRAGIRSGDLVFPMLYAPELLKKEFDSKVADMKNSVKDRSNAQASCAGHFVEMHLGEDYEGGWLHVDMAGPSTVKERGTGYGVGLILSLLGVAGF